MIRMWKCGEKLKVKSRKLKVKGFYKTVTMLTQS